MKVECKCLMKKKVVPKLRQEVKVDIVTSDDIKIYFMLSGRISKNIGENIVRSYTGSTSENTDFHVLVAAVNCACLTTRWKYDVIYLTFLALEVIL